MAEKKIRSLEEIENEYQNEDNENQDEEIEENDSETDQDEEDEADLEKSREDAKKDNHFILSKYSSQFKERKQKGEVVDSWYQVSLKKAFTDEKEPEFSTHITYSDGPEGEF